MTDNSQCADITFSANAVNPTAEECATNGVSVAVVNHSASASTTTTITTSTTSPTPPSAAVEAFGRSSFGVAGALAAVVAVGFGTLI
jgi:hypothetical protein